MTQDIDIGKLSEQINDKADKDLWNTVPNVWNNTLNTSQITNCITEIPQDIKLELNDGTLTLKAGSKVYDGNGLFHTLTTDSGMNIIYSANQKLYYYEKTRNTLVSFPASQSGSGPTLPDDGSTYQMFYNTTDKKVYRYINNAWSSATGYSFPVCLGSDDGTKITSIDQVFNGFGYIGSTVFALPNVKGLIPNGRNADGSLRNIEFENTVVKTYTISSSEYAVYAYLGNILGIAGVGVVDYKEDSNFNFITSTKEPIEQLLLGKVSLSSSKITSFTSKTTFHALDYNDKSVISGWSMPDYSAGISLTGISSPYIAPANGIIYIEREIGDLKINGNAYVGISGQVYSAYSNTIIINKGDSLSWTKNSPYAGIFYPLKGAN